MTKSKKHKNNGKIGLILYILLIFAFITGCGESFLDNRTFDQTIENASTGLVEPLNAYPVTSTGDKVVRIKTNTEQAEITIRLAAEQACKYIGIDNKSCQEDLVGMAWTEVRNFDCMIPGDGSKSYGCWQIHLGYHPEIKKDQAQDPYWAAIWTAKRLVAYGYPKYRDNAIRAHNGSVNNPKTLAYLNTVNEFVYNK